MKLRFKAYSALNIDSPYVLETGRLRGCPKGEPMLVFGFNKRDAEYNLDIVRQAFSLSDKHIISQNNRGSFTVEITGE